ncbi:hypothetical protein AAC387_Pa01g2475 [Persea americana]
MVLSMHKDSSKQLDSSKYVRYTPEQVEALERVFMECPKPSSIRWQRLIRECPILSNIESKKIKVWFQNRSDLFLHEIGKGGAWRRQFGFCGVLRIERGIAQASFSVPLSTVSPSTAGLSTFSETTLSSVEWDWSVVLAISAGGTLYRKFYTIRYCYGGGSSRMNKEKRSREEATASDEDDDLVMPEVPADEAVTDPIATLKKSQGTLEWFQNLHLLTCHKILTILNHPWMQFLTMLRMNS